MKPLIKYHYMVAINDNEAGLGTNTLPERFAYIAATISAVLFTLFTFLQPEDEEQKEEWLNQIGRQVLHTALCNQWDGKSIESYPHEELINSVWEAICRGLEEGEPD